MLLLSAFLLRLLRSSSGLGLESSLNDKRGFWGSGTFPSLATPSSMETFELSNMPVFGFVFVLLLMFTVQQDK